MIYIDTTIRFRSNLISDILLVSEQLGMVTNDYKNSLDLVCYSNKKIFKWFETLEDLYNRIKLVKTNFLVFHRNFLSTLVLKAWVTCALEKECIAPEGSSYDGGFITSVLGCKSCGCHRFDQNALTIISTYFYGHPKHWKFPPAFDLNRTDLFSVEKKFKIVYF